MDKWQFKYFSKIRQEKDAKGWENRKGDTVRRKSTKREETDLFRTTLDGSLVDVIVYPEFASRTRLTVHQRDLYMAC